MDSPFDAVSRSAKKIINFGKSESTLVRLAKHVEEYLDTWKLDFEIEIGSLGARSDGARSVGSYMVRVLNKAHELVIYASEGHQPSPGEFAEIIDDFGRYAIMMNRLIYRNDLKIRRADLNDKIENDCAYLKKALDCKPSSPGDICPPVICSEDLRPSNKGLGAGSYAHAYKATWEREGLTVAVKQFKTGCLRHLKGELVRWECQHLDSSHILKILGCNEKNLFLILELMDRDLDMLMNRSESQLSTTDLVEIIIQMAKGMRFLHSRNVIHRDLKPKNVLLKDSGKETDNQHYIVKIGDFGNSRGGFGDHTSEVFPSHEKQKKTSHYAHLFRRLFRRGRAVKLPEASQDDHASEEEKDDTTMLGSKKYMAPEMNTDGGKYTRSVDVYSFGVTCTNLLSEIRQSNLSLEKLIGWSMLKDHLHRPSFEVICEELWICFQEILLAEDPIPPPPMPLEDPNVEVVDGTIKVSFKLTWFYCITSWIRILPAGRAIFIKSERSNGPSSEAIYHEYKTSKDDDDKMIKITISSQYSRWSAIIDLRHTTPKVAFKATHQDYAFIPHDD